MSEKNIEMLHRHIIIIYYTRKTATDGGIDPIPQSCGQQRHYAIIVILNNFPSARNIFR